MSTFCHSTRESPRMVSTFDTLRWLTVSTLERSAFPLECDKHVEPAITLS